MVDISRYMDDGANWQSQCVLSYVRSHTYGVTSFFLGDIDADKRKEVERLLLFIHVEVGRYENCREQGYVFSVSCFSKRLNITVFEHRNSDGLCLIVFEGSFLNTPTWEDVWRGKEDKWDIDYKFVCGDVVSCGEKVIELFNGFVKKEIVDGFVERLSDGESVK